MGTRKLLWSLTWQELGRQSRIWLAWSGAPLDARRQRIGIGTAYSAASRIWFTVWNGIVTEVYYPTVDMPQGSGTSSFSLLTVNPSFIRRHSIWRAAFSACHLAWDTALKGRTRRSAIASSRRSSPTRTSLCVLVHTRLEGDDGFLKKLRLYVLLAPHLEGRGRGNSALKLNVAGKDLLTAHRGEIHLALGASIPFLRSSCGFVGASDGWTDLKRDLRMDWEFERALDGNVAVMGELDLSTSRTFTLGLAFGYGLHAATTTVLQSLGVPYEEQLERFRDQWHRAGSSIAPLQGASGDGGRLYQTSRSLLLAHEDKSYPGALIASLSIPWGEARGDDDGLGGYHLGLDAGHVQQRDGAPGGGNARTPARALIYLAATQLPSGGFHQNFWIDGEPYWRGVQLDESAFPLILAWRLREHGAAGDFDPYPMVLKAARYLVEQSPVTAQERWEECAGYSPSTLAACIAGLVCAAQFARQRGDGDTARFLEEYADFLESHVEAWTVTSEGSLVPGIARHYIRILPADPSDPSPLDDPNAGRVTIANTEPGQPYQFPAKDIVDAGFLELVRHGIRRAGTPLMEDSLRVVDAILRVEAPAGPCWRRYNNDGYGQRRDGGPFDDWG